MADKLTQEKRSWNMSKIKGKDTKPELLVRKELYKRGYRYRLNYNLEGKPDIVFINKRIAIFLHGCFWHQHGCRDTYRPKTRKSFWNDKLDKNIKRDKKVRGILSKQGWKVITFWECDIMGDSKKAIDELEQALKM